MKYSGYILYRILEILPGLSVWVTLVGAVVLSFTNPLLMIYAVILFDVYWVLRVINYTFYLLLSWFRYSKIKKIDWKEKLHTLDKKAWQSKRHIVFMTLYKEDWVVVKSAITSVALAAEYNKKHVVLVVAGEARAEAHYTKIFSHIKEEFAPCFGDIVGVLHPKDLPGEIPGKGSNLHYAEQYMKKYIDKKQWLVNDIIATIFDIDTICGLEYFMYLTYVYCTHPNPTRTSYQPVALFNNNIWDSPAVLRIMSFGTTFWIFMGLARQDTLVTFSSHSMSWLALYEAGFHDKRIVSEDSRIFYQCFLRYNGQYDVTPLYTAVSMDTVRDDSWTKSVVNLYKQQRRWAWGVEHVPFLIWEFVKKGKKIPLWKKFKWVFIEWEGKWSWCCIAVLITVLGHLPMRVAPEVVRQSALFINTPHLLSELMKIALIGLFLSAILSMPLLPKKPASHPKHAYIIMFFQWALMPITMIVVSAIPAIDAVTHLMRGKYLGFNVSNKKRKTTMS